LANCSTSSSKPGRACLFGADQRRPEKRYAILTAAERAGLRESLRAIIRRYERQHRNHARVVRGVPSGLTWQREAVCTQRKWFNL